MPVTVGGDEGLYLELSLPPDLDLTGCDRDGTVPWGAYLDDRDGSGGSRPQFAKNLDLPGQIDRIWILDVEGRRLLIDASFLPSEQDAIRQRVDQVIDSVRFAVER